jgi:hypothetical protein
MTTKRTKPTFDIPAMAMRVELLAHRALLRDDADVAFRWYSDALSWCEDMASDLRIPIQCVVGFVAALSPRNSWASQLKNTRSQIECAIMAEPIPFAGTNANKKKGLRIINGEQPMAVLGGPKVRAFYQAVLSGGKLGGAVIDVHAWAAVSGDYSGRLGAPQYRAAASAFAMAASAMRMTVHEVQALAWVEHRKLPLEPRGTYSYVWGDNDRAKRAAKGTV